MDLKQYRSEHGLTQKELAEIIGKSKASVMNYEKGKTPIPPEVIAILGGPTPPDETADPILDLKKFRTEHGLTQKQIAEIIGKSSSAVMNYENGKTKIPPEVVETLEKYAAAATPPDEKVGATINLKKFRKDHGYTRKQMAEIIGKSLSGLMNYETGKTKIPPEVVEILEKYTAAAIPTTPAPSEEKTSSVEDATSTEETPAPKRRGREPKSAPVEDTPLIKTPAVTPATTPAEEPAPKKRGCLKGSKNKKTLAHEVELAAQGLPTTPVKRKMGRPVGAKDSRPRKKKGK